MASTGLSPTTVPSGLMAITNFPSIHRLDNPAQGCLGKREGLLSSRHQPGSATAWRPIWLDRELAGREQPPQGLLEDPPS